MDVADRRRRRQLRVALDELHRRLAEPVDLLDVEARLAFVVQRVSEHLGAPVDQDTWPVGAGVANGLRDLLDEAFPAAPTLADASRCLGVSVAHLVRSFTARFAMSPHRYVTGKRVDAARQLLLAGTPPAWVATEVGFYDQAHMARHFTRYVGTTPGRFTRGRADRRS